MHLTPKQGPTRPAGAKILQQQPKSNDYLKPHHPFHDRTVMVTSCGHQCPYRKKINLAGQLYGI